MISDCNKSESKGYKKIKDVRSPDATISADNLGQKLTGPSLAIQNRLKNNVQKKSKDIPYISEVMSY